MSRSLMAFTILALAVAVGLGTALSPFASPEPDGLERVAEDAGFLEEGRLHAIQRDAPIPDYAFPGIENARLAAGVAGFAGTLGVFVIALALARALRTSRARGARAPAG